MPSTKLSRRGILRASHIALIGIAGCQSQPRPSGPSTNSSGRSPTTGTTNTESSDNDEPSVGAIDVTDFVLYPLAGTHPHVYRRAHVQYVIVRLTTPKSIDTVRNRLTLTLDEEPLSLAERQPVPWTHDTVDLAFAVPKTETFEQGRIVFKQAELRRLSEPTISRLNNPPVFELSNISASPSEIQAGKKKTATIQFDLANTGDGRGTFGASLKGNSISGSNTVTATLDSGTRREISASTEIVGKEEATIRLDWGSDEWATDIPVVETAESTESSPEQHLRERREIT